jgi:hypothetical protein
VSTARIPLANGLANAFLHVGGPYGGAFLVGENGRVYIGARIRSGPPHDDAIVLLVPFQERSGPDTELPANFAGTEICPRAVTLERAIVMRLHCLGDAPMGKGRI